MSVTLYFVVVTVLLGATYSSVQKRQALSPLYHQQHAPVAVKGYAAVPAYAHAPVQAYAPAPAPVYAHAPVQAYAPAPAPVYAHAPAPAPVYAHAPGPAYASGPAYARPAKKPEGQDFSKIPGVAGVDYPIYHSVPETNFHCGKVPIAPGIYANVETGCQAYHICHDGREGHQGASFLCTNGTLFNQHEFACDWWYNVNCADAPKLYDLNLDPLKNPFTPKPKKEELHAAPEYAYQH